MLLQFPDPMQQIDPLVHQHLTPLLELLPFLGTQARILQRLRQLVDTLLQLHPTCFVFLNHFFHICPPKKITMSLILQITHFQCTAGGVTAHCPPCPRSP